ncbi:hypothetical protein [Pseudolysinimonas sp.]|uniref:hypothetical protein n=1 Tax=Pseudolysinimonas sp. TaxID=2680009 RepID=UPI00286BC068|nr:hypothetical protein [Pseudolysinimonas sp.]
MKRSLFLGVVFTTVLVLVLPFVGGGGPSFLTAANAAASAVDAASTVSRPIAAASIFTDTTSTVIAAAADTIDYKVSAQAPLTADTEHLAQKPVPKPLPPVSAAGRASGTNERRAVLAAQGKSCPGNVGGGTNGAPGRVSGGGVQGTTSGDIASFAAAYNAIRVANCLYPVPMSNFRYDACMEDRLFWMAEDPSTDPASAWGHIGSQRSDGVPSYGCDGNLAGGSGNSGATVAQKWWNSTGHRNSLYRPSVTGSVGGVCIYFAMTHGGVPNEPYSFTRAAARWGGC